MPQLNPVTRVALYPRVSTEEQKRRGLSVEAQTESLQAWAHARKMDIVDIYNDAGNSARKTYTKRPAMLKLLQDVQAGKIDLIIFTKLDRWFRNVSEYYKVQEILDANHVTWKAIHEDYETATASGRLKVNIMLSVAQDEADRDSERIKDVLKAKRARREAITGSVPTGYAIQNKKIIKDPQWEQPLQAFFDAYLHFQSIATARAEVMKQFSLDITYQLADSLLSKTAYYGLFTDVEDMCPPYITKEQYDEVQLLRKRFSRSTKQKRVYIFSGIIYCGECGFRYASGYKRYLLANGTVREYAVYKCVARYARSKCSNGFNIPEATIEQYLVENLDAKLMEYIADAEFENAQSTQVVSHSQERLSVKRKLERLKNLYVNDLIDLGAYRKDYESLNHELSAIPDDPVPLKRDTSRAKQLLNSGWRGMYDSLSRQDKQVFWRNAVNKITIHPDRSITFIPVI